MKKTTPAALSALILALLPFGTASAVTVTWSGAGANARWDTLANWQGGSAPLSTEVAGFGLGFTSGNPDVYGSRTVAGLDLAHSSNLRIVNSDANGVLTVSGPITRTVVANATSEIAARVALVGTVDTTIASSTLAGMELRLSGGIQGTGQINFLTTGQRSNLVLASNNASWSGGLTIGTTVVNSRVDVFANGGLGTGDITWNGSAIIRLTGDVNHTVSNKITVAGGHTFDIGTGSINRTIELSGAIGGSGNDNIVFQRAGTNNTLVLSGSNANAHASSRLIFYGDAGGGVTRVTNSHALDWSSIIIGQANIAGNHVMYFADGVSSGASFVLNDDAGVAKTTNFVLGSDVVGAKVTLSGDVLLNKYSTAGNTRLLKVEAAASGTTTFSGNLNNRPTTHLNVEKTGAGTVVFSRAAGNAYTGTTLISQGTLLVNNSSGSGTGVGSVTVGNSATLGGSGILAPTGSSSFLAESGSLLAPGSGIGTLTLNLGSTTGSATFAAGASFLFDLSAPGTSDVFAFGGLTNGVARVAFNDNVINFTDLGGLAAGTYTLFTFNANNAYTGSLTLGDGLGAWSGNLIYNANSIQLEVVPEPASMALAGAGLLAAAGLRARRRHRKG